MALPVFRRYAVQDYPNGPDWLGTMFQSMNLFGETTVSALNQNLTIGQNVQGQKFTVSFTTPSNYTSGGFNTIVFAYNGGGQPNCCLIGSIKRNDNVLITSPVTVTDWIMNINTKPFRTTINYVAGLNASTSYTATFLVI